VIDVGYNREQVLEGIRKTQDPQFRKKVQESVNPYDHGDASGSIVKRLIDVELNEALVRKSFHQVP
jgi:UDP-N-acetylglucosamine 2-epimerase